ncbi:hybrid sensor histidine kinase/response regulator transcription factor [Aestuariibaculum marinum]|uniref:histidine kinase n=1 Tax=Aestuariibaculum marinum TaxID=2683592 RepID=A0A8J6U618_9FLAO|nr:substrate-binding domain-containing protein [Aestuariibaculum marinum]MBD0825385.1 substrate-binding domain-containing protein [Aestuariibaculum marinum]
MRNSQLILIFFFTIILFNCQNTQVKKHNIGFSQCLSDHMWRNAMNHSMQIQASLNHNEIDLTKFEAHGSTKVQIAQIEEMIKNKYDLIIVSPLVQDSIVPVIEKAYDAGIPIILLDRKINSDKYTAFVGADNLEVGQTAAKYILSNSQQKNIHVLEIKGIGNSSPVEERSLGFHHEIQNNPNINIVKTIEGVNPTEIVKTLDSLGPRGIDYIYAFNDQLAKQVWDLTNKLQFEKKLKFIGVDGLNIPDGGIGLVQNNILNATILYPTGGDEAIRLALRILNGEKVQKNNILRTTVIDSKNAEIMKNQLDKINQHQEDIVAQQNKINEQEKTYSTQTNILKLVLGLLITSILLGSFSIYSGFKLRKKKRELELRNNKITIQQEHIQKISEAKTNFFTGLSHEFKTPITLILSSIESISDNKSIRDNKLIREVGLIFNNSKRLLRLINQLIDFRKIEDRKFILKASETNLYQFSKSIFKDFEREAQKRNIKFSINTNNEFLKVFIDRNLMDKVYFNILSNAFKFTPNNGTISIDIIDEETNFVKIHFSDSGIGIPDTEMDKVFMPFFQGSNNKKSSSGIGLHLSKEFIELHKGTIEVNSKNGAEFIISLYKGDVHLSSDEIIYEPDIIENPTLSFETDYEDDAFILKNDIDEDNKNTLLIIEDNPDLIRYLNNKLSAEFIIETCDGHGAIEKAFELIPDIIICDVNLPDKNGFEICDILKKDLRTSHIPSIILTAYDSKESYIQGLDSGADLFLTKPFSFTILYRSIKNLLFNREKLRRHHIKNIYKTEPTNDLSNSEQEFINDMNKHVHENIDDSSYNVEQLASDLGISRVQLYRKIKAILNINVSDYIQNLRLEKAKILLQESALSISEIAYSVGFSSPSYFSLTFKNKFGKSPKMHRKK